MAERSSDLQITVGEIEVSIITSENTGKYFELPDNTFSAQMLSRKRILNRGMEMVGNSLKHIGLVMKLSYLCTD